MSSSNVTNIPERFCGLRVLLVEPNIMSLQKHAALLQSSSYQVAITTEASTGLSMIMNGQIFDCILIDADLCETDMEPFLRLVWSHQPQMSIIVMTSYDTHLRIPQESLESGAVLCLLRPDCYTDLCNIWRHILCRNKISSEENASKELLHQQNQVDNNVLTVDPRVEPSAVNGSTAVNNNILSEQHDVSYGDLFPEDVGCGDNADDQEDVNEITRRENIGIDATRKEDKGKQPLIPKRKCDQPVEDDKHFTKKRRPKSRITWKGELEVKFQNALKVLGEQATSKEILSFMNVPGLTRYHVASHQQKHRNKLRSLEADISGFPQKGTEFQAEGVANKRFQHPVRSDEIAPVNKSSSIPILPEHNFEGILYVLSENVRNILHAPLPVPQPTITLYNNYGGDQATVHSSRGKGIDIQMTGNDYANAVDPLVTVETSSRHAFGEARAPLAGDQTTAHSFGVVENSNSGGRGTGIPLMEHNYGNPMAPVVTGETSLHHTFGEAMAPLVDNYCGGQTAAHSFGVVDNSNSDGRGTGIPMMGHNYGNPMAPVVTGDISSHHALADNNYGGGQTTAHSFGVVENSNSGGLGIPLMDHDYGNPMNPVPTGETSLDHISGEAMAPSVDDNYVGGQTTHSFGVVEYSKSGGQGTGTQLMRRDSQDVQVNGENLGPDTSPPATFFDLENSINPGSSLDSIPSRPASANFSIHELPTEEVDNLAPTHLPVNPVFPSYDSEAGYLDNVPSNSDIENIIDFYNGDDGNLFDIPYYLSDHFL